MITKLTQEQELLVRETRKEWEDLFFDNVKEGRGIDKKAFEKGVEWIYGSLLREKMPEIVYYDSWYGCLTEDLSIRFSPGKALLITDFVNQVCIKKIDDFVDDNCSDDIFKFVWETVRKPIESSICIRVVDQIHHSLTIFDETQVFKKNVADFAMYGINKSCVYDFHRVAYYDFFFKAGLIEDADFEKYREFVRSCAFALYMYEDCVFAVHPPVYISRNEDGRLHSIEGPAVKFRDGSGSYFINGRYVPAWIFERKDYITKEKFLNEDNTETRAAMYSVLGQKRMMEMLGAETVHTSEIRHTNGDVETVELLKTRNRFPETGDEPFAWVKVTCPSTGTNYLLGVEPKYENAAEALASLSMFRSEEYSFNFRT
jgi:hypothetical protein